MASADGAGAAAPGAAPRQEVIVVADLPAVTKGDRPSHDYVQCPLPFCLKHTGAGMLRSSV